MTVAAKSPFELYDGDGVTTAFAVRWRYLDVAHLLAEKIAANGTVAVLVNGTDYTATAAPTDAGGTLTLTTALAAGEKLRIRRKTPLAQPAQYPTSGSFPARSHELALDRLTLQGQEAAEQLARTPQVPVGEAAPELNIAAIAPGQVLALVGDKIQGVDNDPASAADSAAQALLARGEVLIAKGETEDIAAQVEADRAIVVEQAGAVAAAMNSSNAPYPNAYASALPRGVTAITVGGTAVTGATVGEYALTPSGGSITGVQATLVVTSATSATVRIDNPGLGSGTTPPTFANPSGATLPVGTTLTATVGPLVANQKTYWAVSADSSQILLCGNNGGSFATAPFGGTQLVLYGKAAVDAAATVANATRGGLAASFDVAKVSAASRVGGLYFDPAAGAYDWGIGMVGNVDVTAGVTFDTVAFWFQVAADTATVRNRLWRRPLSAAWMAQGPGDASDTQLGTTQNIAVGTLGVIPDGPRAYIQFSVGATVTIEPGYLYIHELEALDGSGNRLLSGIEYKLITGLTTDQYRKWRRAGGPTNSWSNQVTSTTFVYCYDLLLDGYKVKSVPEYYAPTVEAATASVNGSTVTISADLSSAGAMADLSGSVTLDAATGSTVTDEPLTLTAAGGAAKTYGYLTNKTVYADLANVVVKDAVTLDVLVKDTHYWVIEELGCFSLPATSGSPRNVLVSYTYKKMRYDLIHYTPATGVIAVTKGTERDRDQSEFIPATPTGAIPLFNVHVRRGGNIAVPVFDVVETIRRARWNEVHEEITRNRRLLRAVIKKLRAGLAVKALAYGDSNLAQMGGGYSLAAIRSAANTIYHDRTKDTGGLLLAPAYGSDILATIPTYDNADGAGSVHTRYGFAWELIRALEAAYSSTITYRNRSIPGSNSSNSTYHGLDSTRLAAATAEVADFALIGFGQNDGSFTLDANGVSATRPNVIAICQAFQAVGTIPIVLGCFRPHAKDLHSQHTTAIWQRIQRELREAAYAVNCPHFSTTTFYDDGENGALGLSPYDLCAGTKDVHPGIREHRIMGQRLAMSFDA